MASAWIDRRGPAYRVRYRLGRGEGAPVLYGGSFRRKEDALSRKQWILGEIAAMRVPDLGCFDETRPSMLGEAAAAWRASRIDVAVQTRRMHASDLARVFRVAPKLERRRVDAITVEELVDVVTDLMELAYKRETIKKSLTAVAMTLDFAGVDPNPARDRRIKLPKATRVNLPPPLAEHVETVAEHMAARHVLPFLIIDAAGPRVNEVALARHGDVDETLPGLRIGPDKNERFRHLRLPEDVFEALLDHAGPREDRVADARLWPRLTDAQLRTEIARVCRATGVPLFGLHGLRRRRGSLHYKQTGSLAEVAELLGDSKRVAQEHYVYAMTDYREADYSIALARLRARGRANTVSKQGSV